MNEVYEFLKKCGTYYLATVEGDQPRVRPFGTIHIFEDKLYIQTGLSKPVGQQMAGGKALTVVTNYSSRTSEENIEYHALEYEQATFDFI